MEMDFEVKCISLKGISPSKENRHEKVTYPIVGLGSTNLNGPA
jgi:hypothetical protein|tara:strand:- start:31 stop:159 length:129 start_codon:yes stop_codon:yes gene_type:complete